MENKELYTKIDLLLKNEDTIDLKSLLECFKDLKSNIQNSKNEANNNSLNKIDFYNYIKPSYYVQKLETIYSGFILAPYENRSRR